MAVTHGITVSVNPTIDPIQRRPAPGIVTLRPAVPADLTHLQRWDQDPDVRGSLVDSDWLIAEVDGRPIGFIQIIDPEHEETKYWGCMKAGHRAIDIWIGEPDARNRGYGAQMMELAIERCFAEPSVHTILIDPLATNVRAHRFYESLGFEYVVCRTFGDDECFVYKLSRPDDTRGHA